MTAKKTQGSVASSKLPKWALYQFRRFWRLLYCVLKELHRFLHRHRFLTETLVCGFLVAMLLKPVPVVGKHLAVIAVTAAALVGLFRELVGQIDDTFSDPKK